MLNHVNETKTQLTRLRRLRLHHQEVDRWINDDIRPLPPARRQWTAWTYIAFWLAWHVSLTNFTMGSSMVALGLSVWQVMLAIIIGRLIIAAVAVAVGFIGADWHIGFPVYSRALWGMRGSYIPMVQRIMCGIVGIAVQSYLGGVCITAMLSAIFPSFHRMSNTLPLSANITTKQFIGWVVFNLLSVPFLCARLERKNLVRIFVALNTYSFFTLLAIMIWAVSRAGGGGPLLSQGPLPSSDIGWGICKAITTVIGSIAVGLMSQPDFTRFARTPGAQVTGQWTSILFFGTLMPLFGCITASATQAIYGQPIWNPTEIALRWLETDYTAKTRASGFFVGFGLMACQLVVNTFENGFSTGMDLAAIAPEYINIRRGALLALAVACAACPWQLMTSASVFLNVVSSYTIIIGPILGIQICDYFVLRRRRLQLSALYNAEPHAPYFYLHGFNWRTIVAWMVTWVPQLPGFINAINPNIHVSFGAAKLFDLSFLFGGAAGFLIYLSINLIFPPSNLRQIDEVDLFNTFSESEAERRGVKTGVQSEVIEVA
ncbi:NCS1 nucleoside transporter family protein [Corynespora cassiicola Philippines]|uniref:NCS1 nucleoside transporter family protein n=1 Tax=Corynespora cassiicola Philippines TaxID=1448308 RepID=A0A2T2NNK3_CORCC|nr:NCS1 nucleoside transporter family protein [Corynespora cassiicola Philippines]